MFFGCLKKSNILNNKILFHFDAIFCDLRTKVFWRLGEELFAFGLFCGVLPVEEVFKSFREQRNGQLMSLVRIFCFIERSDEWKIRLGLWLRLEVSGFEQRKLVKLALIGVEAPVKLWVDEEDDWLMTLLIEPANISRYT